MGGGGIMGGIIIGGPDIWAPAGIGWRAGMGGMLGRRISSGTSCITARRSLRGSARTNPPERSSRSAS
jgi:hypothetical protein